MSKFNLVKLMWYNNKVRKKYRTVSGSPPISFTAESDGTLKNYRIYGNTVNGESVGDKTENLIQDVITGVNISSNGKISGLSDYNVVYAPVVAEESYTISNNNGGNVYAFYAEVPTTETPSSYNGSRQVFNSDSVTFTAPITGYAAVRTASTAQDIMINFGSEALPYEPYGYRVPVTVTNGTDTETKNIYLPEQIKMVGDEAEYIDYAEQKQHKVRKNLLPNTATSQTKNGVTFTVNGDGSIFCNGQASPNNADLVNPDFLLPSGTYILTGCPDGGSDRETYKILIYVNGAWCTNDRGSGANFTLTKTSTVSVRIAVYAGYACDNLTFYPMIRKSDIEDDTYEPYIENTELDVTLPALPTLSGTNTLSVGTTVQPSGVELRGRIMEVDSGGD